MISAGPRRMNLEPPLDPSIAESPGAAAAPDTAAALALARRMYAAGIARDRAFPEAVFDQPAWTIMLDLYVSHHEHRLVNMFAASVGSRVPQSTAHRWLERLEEAGLVARQSCVTNARDVIVALTPETLARMDALLTGIAAGLGEELGAALKSAPIDRPGR